ncbi:MAG: SDR family oxidoreductase [Candidatus Delongbacteria bacterium]|nr:SDR family oxidoreductase [Candidatus Delongbacteria bacterium]
MTRVLITGAFSPIGRAIGIRLAGLGLELVLHYHRNDPAAESSYLESLRQAGSSSLETGQADFRRPDKLEDWWHSLTEHRPLDAIIHNAAVFYPVPFARTAPADWNTFLSINLVAPACLSEFFLQQTHFTDREPGRMIFMVDIYADKVLPGYLPYAVSKAALKSLIRNMARQAGNRFCINGISPGIVNPDTPDSVIRRSVTQTPVPAEEVASACAFLLQQRAINGEIIRIDGGKSLF